MFGKAEHIYSGWKLSAFCLQISLLWKAAVPLNEGFLDMAADAVSEEEKTLLTEMAEVLEAGEPLYSALEQTGKFPPYVVKMAKLGHQTGSVAEVMEELSVYYEKEYIMMQNIRRAIAYPIVMAGMLLVVLFVLFTRVMPVFEQVYAQLGMQLSPVSEAALRFGSIIIVALLAAFAAAIALLAAAWLAASAGCGIGWLDRLKEFIKRRSHTSLMAAYRRFTSVLALAEGCDLDLEQGLELAKELADNSRVAEKLTVCIEKLEDGCSGADAIKESELFEGVQLQMIKVGIRSGHLEEILKNISEHYEQQADASIDEMIARIEPTMVIVLGVVVGLVLLTVMLPLAGSLAGIG